MNFKVLALGALLGFAVAVVPSCGASKCSVANCKGCCSADGKCVADPANSDNSACGTQGNTCVDCSKTNQVCNKTTYQCGVTGTGGGGGDGGSTCGGCTTNNGLCLERTDTTNCGANGSVCKACAVGEYCTNGACTPPDAGIVAGSLGTACKLDSECTGITLASGYLAFCKKQTIPGNVEYKDGYCTRRCLGATQCVSTGTSNNICPFFLGAAGEAENICMRGCNNNGDCRTGYACVNFGSSTQPLNGCWVLQSDGGLPDVYDAGPPSMATAGSACTGNAECGPAPFFYCVPELRSDGGATGFPGGQCNGECTLNTNDEFCGDAGICLPYLGGQDQRGPYITWQCGQRCTPGAPNPGCRTGYVCDQFNTQTFGTCVPDCRGNPVNVCGTGTCAPATGLCQ